MLDAGRRSPAPSGTPGRDPGRPATNPGGLYGSFNYAGLTLIDHYTRWVVSSRLVHAECEEPLERQSFAQRSSTRPAAEIRSARRKATADESVTGFPAWRTAGDEEFGVLRNATQLSRRASPN